MVAMYCQAIDANLEYIDSAANYEVPFYEDLKYWPFQVPKSEIYIVVLLLALVKLVIVESLDNLVVLLFS